MVLAIIETSQSIIYLFIHHASSSPFTYWSIITFSILSKLFSVSRMDRLSASLHILYQSLDVLLELVELISTNSIRIIKVLINVDQEVRNDLIFYESVVVFQYINKTKSNRSLLIIFISNSLKFSEEILTNLAKCLSCIQINYFDRLILHEEVLICRSN